jgi:hypothetical protein
MLTRIERIDRAAGQEHEGRHGDDSLGRVLPPRVVVLAPDRVPEELAVDQRPQTQDAQEGEVGQPQREEQRGQNHQVDHAVAQEPSSDVLCGERAGGDLDRDDQREDIVDGDKDPLVADERRGDEERYEDEVQPDDPQPEPSGGRRAAVIERPHVGSQAGQTSVRLGHAHD